MNIVTILLRIQPENYLLKHSILTSGNREVKVAFLLLLMVLAGCKKTNKIPATQLDLLIENAVIYTVDSQWSIMNEMAIDNGKIVALGKTGELKPKYTYQSVLNLEGQVVYPGFIDGHCHFLGYARTLLNVDLTGTKTMREVLQKTKTFFNDSNSTWVQGRGWDQNDWPYPVFPNKDSLDAIFPNRPVALRRVDGHALWVNSMAHKMAGIDAETQIAGGEVLRDERGEPTGILLDNAADRVLNLIPENVKERDEEALAKAQNNCFAVGLTGLHDAGLPLSDVLFLQQLYQQNKLHMRLYQMIANNEEAIRYFEENGAINTPNFKVSSIKCYMDGALGSRGAWLKAPYHDNPGNSGLQLTNHDQFLETLHRALAMGFQVNTHAIGDMAVWQTLTGYAAVLPQGNQLRWRVEHAQVVDTADYPMFRAYNIIPSVQPTHATSDMYWAAERLGDRLPTAYAYQNLLQCNGWLVGGSDFPVENINPLFGFYAAVARQDQSAFPATGFQTENALSRKQALLAMTLWAAKGAFMENETGSLQPGKYADFVVLNGDIMRLPLQQVFNVKVLKTFVDGNMVYQMEL
ncbi:amidohydrolase family protein [bacterium]|nr:amidohydrolase family protein [bacterium]